mgnify:CR=1 FL=1
MTHTLVFLAGVLVSAGAIVVAGWPRRRATPRNRFRRGGYNLARTLLRTGALERVK